MQIVFGFFVIGIGSTTGIESAFIIGGKGGGARGGRSKGEEERGGGRRRSEGENETDFKLVVIFEVQRLVLISLSS